MRRAMRNALRNAIHERTNILTTQLTRSILIKKYTRARIRQNNKSAAKLTRTRRKPVNTLHETQHKLRHELRTRDKPMSACFTMIERLRQHHNRERKPYG